MIRLSRQRDDKSIPRDFTGARLVDKHVDLIERYFAALQTGEPMKFVSSKWKSVKPKVRTDAASKCAYCEAPTATVAHGDVEHFRPKSIYWWLAYRFDNYLFACQICNQIHKSDNFPISGIARATEPVMPQTLPVGVADQRALAEQLARDATLLTDLDAMAEWIDEAGDLPHPYFEDPEPLFAYKADAANQEVWLEAAGGARSEKAFSAVEAYLGLNREELRKDRYTHFATLATLFKAFGDSGIGDDTKGAIDREFSRLSASNHPFAGMHRYFLRKWELR